MLLPHVVFFPEAFIDLHIVEDQSRRMMNTARDRNWPIGIFLARETRAEQSLPICEEVGTFGRMVGQESVSPGHSKLTLRGKFRGRLHRFEQLEPFPLARVEILTDHLHLSSPETLASALEELISLVQGFKPAEQRAQIDLPPPESWKALFSTLLSSVAMLLPVKVDKKQEWLAQDDLLVRFGLMREEMRRLLQFNRLLEMIPPPAEDPHSN